MSTNNEKVSVVIPTYNRGWIVAKAINSVLDQSYGNIEVIIVNDGSTDNTRETLKEYNSKVIVINQENWGVSAARNAGIRAASGSFIAFLDSDDFWLKEKISLQIDFFNVNPNALICQTEEIWIRNGIKVNPRKKHKKLSGMIFEESLKMCLVSPSSVMLKRSLLDEVGLFDETLPACEDYDLWLRISCKYPIFTINTPPMVVKTGGHSDQLSKMRKLDRFRIKSIDRIIRNGNLSMTQLKAAVTALKEKCSIYISGCIKRGNYSESEKYKDIVETVSLLVRC